MNYFTKAKPYNSLNEYYKAKFGKKIAKVALNGSFTCPNKDGKKGYGGCTYCTPLGSGDLAGDASKSLYDQFIGGKNKTINKWPDSLYIAYLQANSNTYDTIDNLKRIYDELIDIPDLFGIDIATRPDCINEEIAILLSKYNKLTHLTVELGIQTSNEKTGIRINRCLTNEEIINSINILRKYNIEIVVHIINGLPGETELDMMNTISFINKLDIQGIKIHSLLLLKNTKMYEEYLKEPFEILTILEYVRITCMQIANLRDDIIIHRLAADSVVDNLFEPKWTIKKLVVMNEIDKYMRNNNLYQGIYYKKD